MVIKSHDIKVIEEKDWNELIMKTYGRRYQFQQQYDCQDRGYFHINIPSSDWDEESVMHNEIPEVVNGDLMGMKFNKWLERDPKKPLPNQMFDWELEMFWDRNFYPSIYTIANDLHKMGLVPKGEYLIHINW